MRQINAIQMERHELKDPVMIEAYKAADIVICDNFIAKNRFGSRNNVSGTEALVCLDIAARQEKGIQKYGVSVADNPLTQKQWAQHAYEEALDLAIYLKRLIGTFEA